MRRPEVAAVSVHDPGPLPGHHDWEDVPVQLVDLPPITADFFEPWVTEPDPLGRRRAAGGRPGQRRRRRRRPRRCWRRLAEVHTELVGALPYDVEDEAVRHVKTLMVANKIDADGAADRLEVIREWFSPRFPILPVSAERGRAGRPAPRHVRSIGSPAGLHESPWQAGRSDEAVHRARSAAPSWIWPGRSIATSSTR